MYLYSEEQILQAKSVDLLSFLQRTDPSRLVRVSSDTYCLKDHDSLRISRGKWFWFSREIGGVSAVDFLMKVHGLSFLKAVSAVLGNVSNGAAMAQEPPARRLLLPPRSRTSDRVIAYLKGRAIDPEIIRYCLDRGTLYESADGKNAVFVGYDEDGQPRYAALRGMTGDFKGEATGSDKRYSFRMKGVVGNPHLHVFESAIDLLSYVTLEKKCGMAWTKHSLLSLAGVFAVKREGVVPKALEHFLETVPDVKSIHLHLDNDEVGRNATKGIIEGLKARYQVWNQSPSKGKDVNERLMLDNVRM